MLSVFPLFAILGGGLWLSHIARKPIELTLLATCCSVILFLFFCGLLGFLPQGRLTLIAAGLAALIWTVVRHPSLLKQLMEPGPVIAGLVLAGLAVLNRHSLLLSWDEFSHWGQIVRHITLTDAFPARFDSVLLPDYPFGTGLFQYFISIGAGTDERYWLFAENLLKLTALLPLFAGLKWRHPIIVPLAAFLVLSPYVLIFGFGLGAIAGPSAGAGAWDNLLTDLVLGLIAAGAVVTYLRGGADTRSVALALPGLAVLPFLKESGLFFGMVGIGIVFVDQCLRCMQAWRINWPALATIVGCLVAMFNVRQLWVRHLTSLGAPPTFAFSPTAMYSQIHQADFGARLAAVTDKYYEILTKDQFSSSGLTLPDLGMLIIGLAAASLILAKNRWEATTNFGAHAVLLAGFVAYLTLLYLAYLFSFTSYEAAELSSLRRYINTYTIIWLVIALSMLVPGARWWKAAASVVIVTAFLVLDLPRLQWTAPVTDLSLQLPGNTFAVQRAEVRSALGNYQAVVPPIAKVYSIWNNSTGLPFYMTLYETTPRAGNRWCFGLGPARYSGDVWSCDLTPETFVLNFKKDGYQYLFLGSSDEVFWDRYKTLFADGAQASGQRWFRLGQTSDGAERFVPVNVPKND